MTDQENLQRTDAYRRDAALDEQLAAVNRQLAAADWSGIDAGEAPSMPPVFVIGLQRSGTTLIMQVLAEALALTYPDNIVARFWEAPWVGVVVSRSLRDQWKQAAAGSFDSDYGVTGDLFGPHEFGFFLTRWFGFQPTHCLTDEQLAAIDMPAFRRTLARMEHVGVGPLLFKAVALSFNADYLARHVPNARFVHIERDLLYVAQSTWQGRMKRYGDPARWWSLKPAEYDRLRELEPIEQVAGQVFCSARRIERAVAGIDPARCLRVSYADLCAEPRAVCERVQRLVGEDLKATGATVPESFPNRNEPKVAAEVFGGLRAALERFEAGEIRV